jgi:hypothetical protein
MDESQGNQNFTPAEGQFTESVFSDAAASWKADISGFATVVRAIGDKYKLFDYENGRVTNLPRVTDTLIQGISSLGEDRNVQDIVKILAENAKRSVPIKEYISLEQEQRGAGVAMLNNAIEDSFNRDSIP